MAVEEACAGSWAGRSWLVGGRGGGGIRNLGIEWLVEPCGRAWEDESG